MSKYMLDPIIRALVGVPESRLGIVADIANRLTSDRGEEWDARLKTILREGLVAPVSSLSFERNENGHFELSVTGLDLTGEQEVVRLEADRDDDGQWVSTYWDYPDNRWGGGGAFAFPIPATLFISRPAVAGLSFVS